MPQGHKGEKEEDGKQAACNAERCQVHNIDHPKKGDIEKQGQENKKK